MLLGRLPRAEDSSLSDSNANHPATGTAEGPRTILLVEDEILIRIVTADVLRDAGHVVIEASNGEEAVALLGAGIKIDLLVSDLRMPGAIDGLKLVAFVRERMPHLPVLIATSHWPEEGTPPLDLLLKPYSSDELLAAIARAADREGNA